MKVLIFGATGMVGQGVLRECLRDPEVEEVLAVGRGKTGQGHLKLRELVVPNLFNLHAIEGELKGHDACFFCLGKSSVGMTEPDYTQVTHDLTLLVAQALERLEPGLTFIYVSGMSTDSTEKGPVMWARVKGRTENDLLKMNFKAKYMFRPAYIQPLGGITSRTPLYRLLYVLAAPFYPVLKALFPGYVSTTEKVGRAMLKAAKLGAPKAILENKDINELAGD